MKNSILALDLTSSDYTAELGFELWINDQCVFDQTHVNQPVTIQADLPSDDTAAEHTMKLVLKNKNATHTCVVNNEIVKDAVLQIANFNIDDIDLQHIVNQQAVYQHNFNGNGDAVSQQFFNTLGCNGTVTMKFSTPIYLWILENM